MRWRPPCMCGPGSPATRHLGPTPSHTTNDRPSRSTACPVIEGLSGMWIGARGVATALLRCGPPQMPRPAVRHPGRPSQPPPQQMAAASSRAGPPQELNQSRHPTIDRVHTHMYTLGGEDVLQFTPKQASYKQTKTKTKTHIAKQEPGWAG